MKRKICEIYSDTEHLSIDTITSVLTNKTANGQIRNYAYILHDQDVNSDGTTKKSHYHIALKLNNAYEFTTVGNWFGIDGNFVSACKGKWTDLLQYLTHSNAPEKHQYSIDEVCANFDFAAAKSSRNDIYDLVLHQGMTMRECRRQYPDIYRDNIEKIKKLRLDYLAYQSLPPVRLNFYIYGKSGIGKDVMSRALARSLFPQYTDDEDIFFEVGAANSLFEGYDGQPVIIWSDVRSDTLVRSLGGYDNVYRVFDIIPQPQRQNIKYSSVRLTNSVNILNGQESYEEFLDGLAGKEFKGYEKKYTSVYSCDIDYSKPIYEYKENPDQSYRRFPLIIPIEDETFDLYINKGIYYDDHNLYREYVQFQGIRGNMRKLVQWCGGENNPLFRSAAAKTLAPVTENAAALTTKLTPTPISEAELQLNTAEYGSGYTIANE